MNIFLLSYNEIKFIPFSFGGEDRVYMCTHADLELPSSLLRLPNAGITGMPQTPSSDGYTVLVCSVLVGHGETSKFSMANKVDRTSCTAEIGKSYASCYNGIVF